MKKKGHTHHWLQDAAFSAGGLNADCRNLRRGWVAWLLGYWALRVARCWGFVGHEPTWR